jgi:integrase
MSYVKNTLFHRKNGKLHIYIRNDKINGNHLSNNWYGRCYIDGRTKIFSSNTKNKQQAIKILEAKFDELKFKLKHDLPIHEKSFKDILLEYLKGLETDAKKQNTTKRFIKDKFKTIMECKELMNLNISNLTINDINKNFLVWRMKNKKLSGATLSGDLTAIQGFLNWCYKKGYRKQKVTGISTELLTRELRHQRTRRIGFTKAEYQKLLTVSRARIKAGNKLKTRFERERMHQFIIFMTGTGLRVDECLNLHWDDVTFGDREKELGKNNMEEDDRYYTKINVSKSKTGERECYGLASSYFALQRLMKLYRETGLQKIEGKIFGVKSFRTGLNSLLAIADLKKIKIGDKILHRDSKSFRNTFIQWCLDKGVSTNTVARMCGTSTKMIDKHYTANTQLQSMLDVMLKTGRTKLKQIS